MGAPGPTIGNLARGRANRREYWLWIAGLLALGWAVSTIAPVLGLAGAGVVAYAQVRRLHDFGRTGWWAAAALAAQIPAALGLYAVFGDADATYLVGDVIVLVPITVIGAIAGDPYENRFGPAPGRRPLKDTFT